jgi:hypothetical protein
VWQAWGPVYNRRRGERKDEGDFEDGHDDEPGADREEDAMPEYDCCHDSPANLRRVF